MSTDDIYSRLKMRGLQDTAAGPTLEDFAWNPNPNDLRPPEDIAPPYPGTIKFEEETKSVLPPLIWFNDIWPQPDTNDFVQGVLVENSATVVYGESNSGKTFWTTDLALHIAAGMEWNKRRVEQGGVIYCVLEGGSGFRNRVAAWKEKHSLEGKAIPFAALAAQINLLDPAAHTTPLIEMINQAAASAGMPIKLIVIDTLSRALAGGNENASEDMGALVMNMDRIRQETKAAVLFIHHSGKDQAKGARGWSGLRAAIDTEIEITVDVETDQKKATVLKQRELSKGSVFEFSLIVEEIGVNRHGEPVTTCLVSHSEHPTNPTKTRHPKMSGHPKQVFDILCDLLNTQGIVGAQGVPANVRSIKARAWRHSFYDRAMPDQLADTKDAAFRRATNKLIEWRLVGMSGGNVWLGRRQDDENETINEGGSNP